MDKVEEAYKEVINQWLNAKGYPDEGTEFKVAVSELMIAVMELTGEKLMNAMYKAKHDTDGIGEEIRASLELHESLTGLQQGFPGPQ